MRASGQEVKLRFARMQEWEETETARRVVNGQC
jgi:hypothetical protein